MIIFHLGRTASTRPGPCTRPLFHICVRDKQGEINSLTVAYLWKLKNKTNTMKKEWNFFLIGCDHSHTNRLQNQYLSSLSHTNSLNKWTVYAVSCSGVNYCMSLNISMTVESLFNGPLSSHWLQDPLSAKGKVGRIEGSLRANSCSVWKVMLC